jgi:hypothetical protein
MGMILPMKVAQGLAAVGTILMCLVGLGLCAAFVAAVVWVVS